MDSKTVTQCNKLIQLETYLVMYGTYNAKTLEQLINTVHWINNTASSPNEKLFAGKEGTLTLWSLYANAQGIKHFSINSLLYMRTLKD